MAYEYKQSKMEELLVHLYQKKPYRMPFNDIVEHYKISPELLRSYLQTYPDFFKIEKKEGAPLTLSQISIDTGGEIWLASPNTVRDKVLLILEENTPLLMKDIHAKYQNKFDPDISPQSIITAMHQPENKRFFTKDKAKNHGLDAHGHSKVYGISTVGLQHLDACLYRSLNIPQQARLVKKPPPKSYDPKRTLEVIILRLCFQEARQLTANIMSAKTSITKILVSSAVSSLKKKNQLTTHFNGRKGKLYYTISPEGEERLFTPQTLKDCCLDTLDNATNPISVKNIHENVENTLGRTTTIATITTVMHSLEIEGLVHRTHKERGNNLFEITKNGKTAIDFNLNRDLLPAKREDNAPKTQP